MLHFKEIALRCIAAWIVQTFLNGWPQLQNTTRNDVYETLCPQPFACQELRVHNTRDILSFKLLDIQLIILYQLT